MDFQEYTRVARSTAVYPEQYRYVYPAIGLVEEVSEFVEKFEDWYIGTNGGWVSKYSLDEVVSELSDVLWFYTIFCDDNHLDAEWFFDTTATEYNTQRTLIDCGKFLGVVQKATRKNEFPISALKVMPHLDSIAGAINGWCDELGVTLEDVMEINIAKLQDRANRNVIHGEGDKR